MDQKKIKSPEQFCSEALDTSIIRNLFTILYQRKGREKRKRKKAHMTTNLNVPPMGSPQGQLWKLSPHEGSCP